MASRGDMAHALEQCVSRLKDRQTQLQERAFPENYVHTQQALEEHRDESLKVARVKDKLEEIQESRGHTRDFENAENQCLLTQDLQHQRTRCLETLLYVSEVENVFQNAQADLEDRALYLSSRPQVFDSVYRGEDVHAQSKMHKDCVHALQKSWSWLQTLTQCMRTHVENTAGYHQFYHDVRHLEEDMTSWLLWLDSATVRAKVKTTDPDTMLKHFRLLLTRVLDYQHRVQKLASLSREVYPIHLRKELPDWPVKAKSLVKYTHNEVSLEKDAVVTVLDNSDPERWKIQTSDNTETEVPAIVLVIPPPDPVCFQEINKLREQVYVNSQVTSTRLRTHFLQFLSQVVQALQPKEIQGLSASQKSDYLKLANEATQLLSGLPAIDPESNKLKTGLTHFRKLLSQAKPGKQPLKSVAAQRLSKTEKLLQLYKELQIYASHFYDESEKLRGEESFLVTSIKTPPRYTSKAYFQRIIPMVDIDILTKETKVLGFKSDLYIYERNAPRQESMQQVSSQLLRAQQAPLTSSRLVNGHASEDLVDGLDPSSLKAKPSNIRDFIISGVVDPQTGKKLTVAKALAKGVLNKEFGLYNNLETGESMPIAEAIAKGFITVDYVDPANAANAGGISNGYGPAHEGDDMLNKMEVKAFSISEVVDPRTGEIISVPEAIAAGLIDPKTGTFRNPVTGEELSLVEAVRANYVIADPGLLAALDDQSPAGALGQGYTSYELEESRYKVSGVLDPSTGQQISLQEAMQKGIIDASTGLYKNPVSGETMPLEKAIERGLVSARPFDPKRDRESDEDLLAFQQLKVKHMTFTAGEPGLLADTKPDPEDVLLDELREKTDLAKVTVADPRRQGKQVALEDAVDAGLLSLARDSYKAGPGRKWSVRSSSGGGLPMSLQDACEAGFISPEELKEILRVNNNQSPDLPSDQGMFDPKTGLLTDPKTGRRVSMRAAVDAEMIDPDTTFLFDAANNKVISVEDAVNEGLLDADSFIKSDSLELDGENGVDGELSDNRIPLVEACRAGYIEPPNLKEILKAYEAHSLQDLVDQGLFDPETGLVTDPNTGQMLTLKAAIEAGIIDPDLTFFFDLNSSKVMSLAEAFKQGRLDEVSGKIVKADGSGASMSVKDAIAAGEISPAIEPAELAQKAEALAFLRGCMDTRSKGFKVPGKSDLASVEEAVMLGALQLLPKPSYFDLGRGEEIPLPQAVQMELVSPDIALQIFSALDKHSLEQEIANGSLDPKSGKFVDPATGQLVAVDQGGDAMKNPDYIFVMDKETGKVTSLGALIKEGKFDPASGKFISATSGKPMSLEDAIAEGLLEPRLEGERFIDTSQPLKDLVDSGRVNPRTADFVAANGLRMSLRDGLANGFLTLGSRVKVNPETGDVLLVSDEVVVQSLVEVKESSDWLVDIERALASHGKPSEKLSRLKMQAEECVGLREEINRKESDIQAVVGQAEKLVQAQAQEKSLSKAPTGSPTKDESVQQFQKLKSSAADLKIRFDMVSNEAESRSGQIVTLGRNLEELYYHMEELDQWLDSAIERCQDLQAAKLDIGRQYSTFKDSLEAMISILNAVNVITQRELGLGQAMGLDVEGLSEAQTFEFVEEVKDKEEDLAAIVKSADFFKDHSQTLERDITDFRKKLNVLPTMRDEGEGGVLDEELESIEAKFKDISRECAKQMDRLSSLVKCRKTFDDLNEKLAKAYPSIQEKLSALVSDELALDPQKGMQGLEALRSIKAEVIGQERKLKDLLSAGDRLLYGLEESGMPDEAEEIQALLGLRQEEHGCLLADVTDHEQLLDAAVVRHQNALGRLGAIEDELQAAERALDASTSMSLDKEKLGEQLEAQRIVNAGLSTCKAQLERLQQEAAGNPDEEDTICDLLEQAKALEAIAEQRTQELEDLMSNLGEFESKATALDSWLTDSIKILNPQGNAPRPNRAKVDGLHEAKKEKEPDMQELREMCEHLIDGGSGDSSGDITCQYTARETLAEVEGKWNDLTELLVQQVSLEALSEIDSMLKYLDKAESQINTAEPISIDPETLGVQLRDHKSFDEDLRNKRGAVKEIIDKCTHMLRETANSQTDEIKTRLNSISQQADVVCRLSAERLQQLESALPLAGHYGENQLEVSAWLEEMEAEIAAQGSPGDSLEQVKKQHDNLKMTQQIIEDHKLFIDDLNSTGIELMDVCSESDAVDIQNRLMDINKRYEGLKSTARSKARDLTDAKKKLTQEATDSLEHLLEDLDGLHRTVSGADPVPASPDKLRNEIDENKAVLEDLERQKPAVAKAQEMLKNPKSYGIEDEEDVAEVKEKMDEIVEMTGNIRTAAMARDKALCSALKLSERFFDLSTDVMSGLRDLRESLLTQEPPGIDPEGIKEQQAELAGQKKELEKARELVGDCKRLGADLTAICGEPGAVEVKKAVEDLGHMTDDVNDAIRERGDELRKAFQHADKFAKLLESIHSWLPYSEHRQAEMKPISANPDTLQDQVEELKAFKAEVHPHIVEMQQLNQEMAALKDVSPIAAEVLQKPVKQAMEKWAELLRGITDREVKLTDMQLKVGEVSQGMDDIITFLDSTQPVLDAFDEVRGDPKCLEQHMRRLQLMQADVRNKEKAARKLNKAVDELVAAASDDEGQISASPIEATRQELNEKLRATQAKGREKENRLQELMRQVKKYLGDLDDQLAHLNEFRAELKTNKPFGALPETAENQYAAFVKKCQALDDQERDIDNLLSSGQDLVSACSPKDAAEVADRVKRLKERWADTRDRARKRKEKMEEHLRNVSQFHETLKKFTDWLNSAEIGMRSFKHPSKLVDTITRQMDDHNVLLKDIKSQEENVGLLDSTGTYLKYYGHKQDTVYVKNLLVGIRLRWKKLQRRADERARLLHACYREDKRFDDSWRNLCDWLDESMQKLSRFLTPANQPAGMKQDIDELKKFNLQLTAKHPKFYSTSRLGRNLKDRCTKNDPEREVLNGMLEGLKAKWNGVRSVISKSQNKLDEALLTSGRVSDALQSLLEWLQKAEAALDDEAPVLGDLDTVHMLIEQHRNIQQELAAREATVVTMRAPGNLPPTQAEELSNLWERVNHLCDVRESRLKEGLKLADEFQEVVTVMREFLPQAEAQLKFRALPEDEMVILQLIERHEKFQEELRNHQDTVDKIKSLAEEILLSCHPNAVRFVKYYLTITQTRWDQLLQRAQNRGQRLQEALRNIQGNAALLEELLAWLTDAQALLATKERDPIPDDLKVVETLLKEHLEFHDEVTSKNNDAERLSKLVTSESKMAAQGKGYGSNMKLNEFDGYNPRVIALQNKWRTVWHMSVDRKKRLQDAHDTLLELESFKNFDFDLWRQRYLNWIQAKKFRITDFFRRQDKDSDGFLDREEFVNGMLQSKFPTNRTELNAVFDIFDGNRTGLIEYKNFVDALKTDRKNRAKNNNRKSKSDMELIHEEIEKELSSCQCRQPFRAEWLDEGKYRFGEKQKTCLVRFLNHTVMVRVGGGWVTLEEFVEQNDPCKAKGRTNFDLREHLNLQDGTSPGQTGHLYIRRGSAGGRTSPFPTGASRRRPPNDAGYASSTSSGSGDSSLRRSRITSSMVNLAGNGGTNHYHQATNYSNSPLGRSSDAFGGSTGNLSSRSKRLSTSSSNLSGRRTPTSIGGTASRRANMFTPRATTPTVAFGSSVRSRPTTPTSLYPSSQRPGSVTPTKGLGSGHGSTSTPSSGASRQRRLPSTPRTPTGQGPPHTFR